MSCRGLGPCCEQPHKASLLRRKCHTVAHQRERAQVGLRQEKLWQWCGKASNKQNDSFTMLQLIPATALEFEETHLVALVLASSKEYWAGLVAEVAEVQAWVVEFLTQ